MTKMHHKYEFSKFRKLSSLITIKWIGFKIQSYEFEFKINSFK